MWDSILEWLDSILGAFWVVAIIAGAIVTGPYSLFKGFTAINKGSASWKWQKVDGKVLSSTLVEETVHTASLKEFTRNIAEVVYQYSIGGERYESSRVSFNENLYASEPGRILNSYPPGRLITVYVAPDKPKEAVIEPGVIGPYGFIGIFVGIILTIGGVALVWKILFGLWIR